jgi:hypothetical protein
MRRREEDMSGVGTLKIAFIYPDQRDAHPLARFCLDPISIQQAIPTPSAFPLAAVAAPVLFDVASKVVEAGVTSLIDAAAMRLRAEATTLDATVPVDGIYNANGTNDIDQATLVLHNGNDAQANNASLILSLSFVASPDSTAFRPRVHHWAIDRFLNPKPHAFLQHPERDWVIRIEFLTPGREGPGSRMAFVELVFQALTLAELQTALYIGQDLHWLAMPALPMALAAGPPSGSAGHYLPFNVRATIVETTKPRLFAKWVEESLTANKANLGKAAVAEFRSTVDPAQKATDDAAVLKTASTGFTSYRSAWDALQATIAAEPVKPPVGATDAETEKYDAAHAKWEGDKTLQQKTVLITRSMAVIAFRNAGINWPGDL